MTTTALANLTRALSAKLDMGDGAQLIETLKATAFKGNVSDAQMTALLVVANQYGLNPWTKEIYAFPDRQNGIVPVVGVDGWARIINSHPQFDGIDFEESDAACTCSIYRKDRARPTRVTEFASECRRDTGPWKSHPRRMLRHKAMIQCARLAFGFGGIYDPDEAERIDEAVPAPRNMGQVQDVRAAPAQPYDAGQFEANFPKWEKVIASGRKSHADLIAFVQAKGRPLSEEQKARILSVRAAPAGGVDQDTGEIKSAPVPAPANAPASAGEAGSAQTPPQPAASPLTYADVAHGIYSAATQDALDSALALIGQVADPGQREELAALIAKRRNELDDLPF